LHRCIARPRVVPKPCHCQVVKRLNGRPHSRPRPTPGPGPTQQTQRCTLSAFGRSAMCRRSPHPGGFGHHPSSRSGFSRVPPFPYQHRTLRHYVVGGFPGLRQCAADPRPPVASDTTYPRAPDFLRLPGYPFPFSTSHTPPKWSVDFGARPDH
jgi:hypothetical protein